MDQPGGVAETDQRPATGLLRRQLTNGTALVFLFCAPIVGIFAFGAVHAAQQHRWAAMGGSIWAGLVFFGIPVLVGTRAATWCWDRLRGRRVSTPGAD
jgi:hypothetical protein